MAPTSRTAVVTGANKGIGYAIVRHLALNYPKSALSNNGTLPLLIYLTARDRGRGEAAVKSLEDDKDLQKAKVLSQDGGLSTVKYHGLDISKEESIRDIADFLKKEHPDGIDVVINNAGVALDGFGMLASYSSTGLVLIPLLIETDTDSNIVKQTLQSNYHGTLLSTQLLTPLLRAGGRLVNVASIAGVLNSKYSASIRKQFLGSRTVADVTSLMDSYTASVEKETHTQDGWPASAAYSVSKSGVIGFTRVLAAEEKAKNPDKGVLVNACCPGYVVTDMTKGRGAKTVDEGAQTPVMLALADIGGTAGEFWQNEKIVDWQAGTDRYGNAA